MLNVSYIVNSVFSSRTYFLSEDNTEFWLVDCGDVPLLVDLLSSIGGHSFQVKGVLLTHAHFDHIYGLPRLRQLFPELRVYTNESGKKALVNPRLNMSKYHNAPIAYDSENVVVCGEGDIIDLFDGLQTAKVYETPGHNPSCLTFEVDGYLFTGDAYIPGEKVVTILPGADKKKAEESLFRIGQLAEGKIICPGHEVTI